MSTSAAAHAPQHADAHGHDHDHGHGHHVELGFLQKYIFSTDHKVIGVQYGITALLFLFLGFSLMMMMRWSIAHPGHPLPLVGPLLEKIFGTDFAPKGVMTPALYNSFGAMHGTIMVFLGVVPLAFGAFGNLLVPLQIGAPDMAFPKLNMMSYHVNLWGGAIMLVSFFIPGGSAQSGWTSYPPLSVLASGNGQVFWLVGMVFLISSSLLGSVNLLATVIQLRAPGLTWMRLPFFTWAQFVTAFLLLLAFPPLEAAGVMQLMDKVAHTTFFLPTGLAVGNTHVVAGGNPLLWQHLFWFLAHPEVYVLILPAMGIVCEIIANNTRKPIWGYKSLVYASMALGFMSFIVWAHHMYLTGMSTRLSTFFQTTTMIISIPSVIILTCLVLSLWGGSIRFTTPMLFVLAFLPMFGIGGLTGLPLGFGFSDLHLHDTYYVIAHFHYVVAPGTIFALFGGVYFWYPKVTGRFMSEYWGKVHFFASFIFMNLLFMPMFAQGMAGMLRRMHDGGVSYATATLAAAGVSGGLSPAIIHLNVVESVAAWCLGLAQIPFIINFFWSIRHGKEVPNDNPWDATTLEWQTPTPPPHGNFDKPITVYRGPYEYSVPGHDKDFIPQSEPA